MKRTYVALACALLAVSGLSACSQNKTVNSLDLQNSTAHPKPSPTVALPGIATVSYCVGQSGSYQLHNPVTISLYRNNDVLGLKNTTVGTRVDITMAAGSYDLIVDNVILHSGVLKNGQTYRGQTGRLCDS